MVAARRIRLLTVGCVLITALAIGGIAFNGFQTLLRRQRAEALESRVVSDAQRLSLALDELWNDTRLLALLPVVESALDHPDPTTIFAERERLASTFAQLIRAKSAYAQVRLIAVEDGGRELVRVDRVDGVPRRARPDELQRKGGHTYFKEAIATPPSEVYVSSITLNREQGQVEVPHRPMLRAAVSVRRADGRPFGIVIINLELERLLDDLGLRSTDAHLVYITNRDGDYLLHPDESQCFGFDLGERHRAQDDRAELSPLFAPGGSESFTVDDEDRVMHFRRVHVFPGDSDRYLVLGAEAPAEALAFGAQTVVRQVTLVTAALAVLMLGVSLWVSRVQTRPLEQITRATQAFSRGEPVRGLPVQRRDELGTLARAFEEMTSELRRKTLALESVNARLSAANDDLGHFVHIAAHDLREPLRKLVKLVDLLSEDLEDGDEAAVGKTLGYIRDCSTHMQAMVDNFRELTRVGQAALVREPTAIEPIVQEVLEERRSELEARGVVVELDELPSSLLAYPSLVKLLYASLLDNALGHVPTDGFTVHFTAAKMGPDWRLGVLNTGSSLPAEEARHIFKLFRKGNTDASAGTGLGLSLCKKIVDRHRGWIGIQPDPDSFHVQFELEPRDADSAERQ